MKHKKTIIFRADGNASTGLGHLYRTFALIEMFKAHYNCLLLTREDVTISVIPKSYTVKFLPKTLSTQEEVQWIASHFNYKTHIIFADGYHFNSEYQKALKTSGYFLVYIDDLTTEHMYADIVVNHSAQVKKESYSHEKYTEFALGTDFAILRPSFLNNKAEKFISKTNILDEVFVCFGGSDENDFTHKTLVELLAIPEVAKINVVVGGAYKHKDIYNLEDKRISIHRNLSEKRLFNAIKNTTFAIAPTSTILLELIAVNAYIITGYYAQNQEKGYKALIDLGAVTGIGDLNKYKFTYIKNHILKLTDKEITNQLATQKKLIDGNQKSRFLKLLS